MAEPTYEDYLWTAGRGEFSSFCLTYYPGRRVTNIVPELPIIEEYGVIDYNEIVDLTYVQYEEWDPANQLVGLIDHGNAAIMLEANGFAGSDPRIAAPLSVNGQQVVSYHYSDGNVSNSLSEFSDGRMIRHMYPEDRVDDAWADTAERLASLISMMIKVGFDELTRPTEYPAKHRHNRAATFALMERLTGIVVEPSVFDLARYTAVRVHLAS
ncbi:DUF6461 domain-containing protein [Gordonia sp. HY442]|uniref:DUF6461 domain-containing protein n=1 Tax=Gordonia zhenghanii TaxID=2911516 RepID=UPI001F30D732|nr:DUF6461 domain-containing protein [Gordonia zhenghanii]MCF8607350.1 DUF6461 domain-containing protein [Gordonia zhenghanii]